MTSWPPAQRAFRRVAIKVRAENAKLELSLVLGYLGNKKPKPKNLKPVR